MIDYTSEEILRYFRKINKNGSIPAHCPELGKCWEWTAAHHEFGYGHFGIVRNGKLKHKRSHRMAWELVYGEIPHGLNVLHKCDNPPCCNPAHLFLGTHEDNVKDREQKGRTAKGDKTAVYGEQSGNHKLTVQQVLEIRKRYNEGIPRRQLAKEYGLSKTGLRDIVLNLSWCNVSDLPLFAALDTR